MAKETISEFVPSLAENVGEFTKHETFIHKKLICCPPDDKLNGVMLQLLPHMRAMRKICEDALG